MKCFCFLNQTSRHLKVFFLFDYLIRLQQFVFVTVNFDRRIVEVWTSGHTENGIDDDDDDDISHGAGGNSFRLTCLYLEQRM